MPTIAQFEQTRGILPEAPAATDVNPERFGRDSAALGQLGGQLGEFGNKLMEARKRASDSDAIAAAQSDFILKSSKFEDDARAKFQTSVMSDNKVPGSQGQMAESIKENMGKMMEEQLKALPSGDAQNEYIQRMRPVLDKTYLSNLDWENKARAATYKLNLNKRDALATQELYKKPSQSMAIIQLNALKEDIAAKTGTVFSELEADAELAARGKGYVSAMFNGMADSDDPTMAKYGRGLLKDLPPELARFVDGDDLKKIENKFDQSDRERRVQDDINRTIEIRAKKENQDRTQSAVLDNIYSGKATVKDILRTDLDPDKKQQMIKVLEARANEPDIPDPKNMRNVVNRMMLEPGDPDRIFSEQQVLDQYTNGKLSWSQSQQAIGRLKSLNSDQGQIEGSQIKSLFKHADQILAKEGPTGLVDPDGAENSARFIQYANEELAKARKRGEDVTPLLDPNDPKSLWKKVDGYRKTPQQTLKAISQRMRAESAAKNGAKIEPKEGTVRVIAPNGSVGSIPKENLDAAIKSGYKTVDSGGRSPQSISPTKKINAAGILESFYGGYESDEAMVDAIARAPDLSKDEKLAVLKEVLVDIKDDVYELGPRGNERMKSKVEEELRIVGTPKNEGKAKGRLPVLRTRKATAAEARAEAEYRKKNPEYK